MAGAWSSATATVPKLLAASPDVTATKYKQRLPIRNSASLEKVLSSLRRAGLAEGD